MVLESVADVLLAAVMEEPVASENRSSGGLELNGEDSSLSERYIELPEAIESSALLIVYCTFFQTSLNSLCLP